VLNYLHEETVPFTVSCNMVLKITRPNASHTKLLYYTVSPKILHPPKFFELEFLKTAILFKPYFTHI